MFVFFFFGKILKRTVQITKKSEHTFSLFNCVHWIFASSLLAIIIHTALFPFPPFAFFWNSLYESLFKMIFHVINFIKTCQREQVNKLLEDFLHEKCREDNFWTALFCNITRGVGNWKKANSYQFRLFSYTFWEENFKFIFNIIMPCGKKTIKNIALYILSVYLRFLTLFQLSVGYAS